MDKIENSVGMVFVYIPAGKFMMGSPNYELGRFNDEILHDVTLTKEFYMQTTQVTQGQWKTVMGNNPSYFKDCGDNCPVESISWNDVQEFIEKLHKIDTNNYQYSLPTEAQWEYAARAGTTTPFAFGKCLSTDDANYNGNYPIEGCLKGKYREKPMPVGSLRANVWGIYDMYGNVWEWCQDWYGDYDLVNLVNPVGPSSGQYRVLRGGGWYSYASYCRSAYRFIDSPGNRNINVGFRLVLHRKG